MKKLEKALFIIPAMLILAGCNTPSLGDYQAIVKDVQSNDDVIEDVGTKAAVIARFGQPQRRTPIFKGKGECFDYTRNLNGKPVPFYVAFNQRDAITTSAHKLTCSEAAADGDLSSDESLKDRRRRMGHTK